MKYLANVTTLQYASDKCKGCGQCTGVCPHGVFFMRDKRAAITDKDLCMECALAPGTATLVQLLSSLVWAALQRLSMVWSPAGNPPAGVARHQVEAVAAGKIGFHYSPMIFTSTRFFLRPSNSP